MSNTVNPLSVMATAPTKSSQAAGDGSTWFQAMAEAWGQTLDNQANKLESLGTQIGEGGDQPSTLTQMSAEALKMGFLSQSSHTALSSTGEALKTMAQKS